MKNKKGIQVVIILLCMITLIGSAVYLNNRTFININAKKLYTLSENTNERLIYIGRPTCGGCIEVEPLLKKELEENNLQAYYYNTDKAKKREYDVFQDVKKDFEIESIPLIIYYKDGKEVARFDYYDFEKSKDNSVSEFMKNTILK